nr:MAG TPA: hypothetical protein [Caudoviricetes sp.]
MVLLYVIFSICQCFLRNFFNFFSREHYYVDL